MTHREALASLFAAWRGGDALRAGAHFAPDATYREAGREPIAGREAIVEFLTRFFRDGPRWEIAVDELVVEDDRAAVQYRFSIARADGTWHERPGCAFVSFVNGTVKHWREYEG